MKIRPPSLTETGRSLAGIFTVLEGKPEGFEALDTSLSGALRSFLVFLWCWPAQAFLWTGIWRSVPEARPDGALAMVQYFLTGGIFDFLSWLLPALILYPISRPFGFRNRYLRLIAATNWFGLVATYVSFLPATVEYLSPVPEQISAILSLVAYGLTIGLYFRLTRFALDGEGLLAAMVTLITLMASLLISAVAFNVMGI